MHREGIEPPANSLEESCSVHLSYRCFHYVKVRFLARAIVTFLVGSALRTVVIAVQEKRSAVRTLLSDPD